MIPTILGRDTTTGRDVTLEDISRTSGMYVLGKSGMGKSSLLASLAIQSSRYSQGVFLIDPHGDITTHVGARVRYNAQLLDVADECMTFGINLLSCRDITSITERSDTYTRAYSVFHKIFQDERGELSPWLQLILQYSFYVFIENPEYTLAELPLFLTDPAFRTHLLKNVQYAPDAVAFWRYEFDPVQAQAALTRIRILLGNAYISHIIGQKTTIDFADLLGSFSSSQVVLLKLSANLSIDVKKFIGTIVFSELLHAVRNRREQYRAKLFHIIVDEMHNFVSSEEVSFLITEGRKFGVSFTGAHQERYGQLADTRKIAGATLATVNKVFFQLSVTDAQEVAAEFAEKLPSTPQVQTVFSPHAVAEIWDRGHTSEYIMDVRKRFFHLIELSRVSPQDGYYSFNPRRAIPHEENQGVLHYDAFDDWGMYRATPEMLREGIALINAYYYDYMQAKPFTANNYKSPLKTAKELQIIRRAIDCLGGVLGFRPVMEGYISPEMQQLFIKKLNYKYDRDMQEYKQMWEHGGGKEAAAAGSMYPGPWAMNRPGQLSVRMKRDHPEWFYRLILEDIPVTLTTNFQIEHWRSQAVDIGFTQGELANFIEWQKCETYSVEEETLTGIIRVVANMQADKAAYERAYPDLYRKYVAIMSLDRMKERFGLDYHELPNEETQPYLELVTERIHWQLTELQVFIQYVFNIVPIVLDKSPITGPGTNYADSHKRELSSADMVGEMVKELTNLPRYTAFTKIHGGTGMEIHRIQTQDFMEWERFHPDNWDRYALNPYLNSRTEIVAEMQKRQTEWRRSPPSEPSNQSPARSQTTPKLSKGEPPPFMS